MVRPAAVRLFREQGIEVHEVHRSIEAQRDDEGIEVDLLVVNDTDIVAIECKSTLGTDDIKEHVGRLDKLKRLLPTYAGKRVMGAVTGMVIPDNVAICLQPRAVCHCPKRRAFADPQSGRIQSEGVVGSSYTPNTA
jgi:hypothetical protein